MLDILDAKGDSVYYGRLLRAKIMGKIPQTFGRITPLLLIACRFENTVPVSDLALYWTSSRQYKEHSRTSISSQDGLVLQEDLCFVCEPY